MHIFITGISRGFGFALTEEWLRRGQKVTGTVRTISSVERLKSQFADRGDNLSTVVVDLACDDCCAVLGRWAKEQIVDVVINNSGISSHSSIKDFDYRVAEYMLRVNTLGAMAATHSLLPALRRGWKKLIVSVSSQMGSLSATDGQHSLGYKVSKAGLNMAMRHCAGELASEGITVVAVHPGWMRTNMGGPNAPDCPETAAAQVCDLILTLTPKDSGRFMDSVGRDLLW